jgi:hypothetical protein
VPLIRHNFFRFVEMFAAIHFRVAFAERRGSKGVVFKGLRLKSKTNAPQFAESNVVAHRGEVTAANY